MKCGFESRSHGELHFYLKEVSLASIIKSMALFLPMISLMVFDNISITLKLILGLSYLMKVSHYLLLNVNIQGFTDVYHALKDRQTSIEQNLSTLKIFKKQERSLKKIQEIYALGLVILCFGSLDLLKQASIVGIYCIILFLFYEFILFYFKTLQLKQVTTKCFIRAQSLTR